MFKGSVQNGLSPFIENSIIPPKQKEIVVGLPIRLIIPEINFNSNIEQVGLIANNTLGVPKGRNDVAWFDAGTRPGNIGSAVIDGHYGWWANDGLPAVFNNLPKLHKGDYIYVEDNKGIMISFVVSKIQIYNPQSDSAKVFSSNDGKSHLNLITCEGIWNNVTKTYSNRMVVFTNKVTI
jgi:LPXTG-site transpeptidase (sortase) family protein